MPDENEPPVDVIDRPIAAITVTYFPNLHLLRKQIESVVSTANVIIVDNGSDPATVVALAALSQSISSSKVIFLGRNCGIAKAQNIGAAYALEKLTDLKYLLFLDQDTLPKKGSLKKLLKTAYLLQEKKVSLGAVGPNLVDPRTGDHYGFHRFRFLIIRRDFGKNNKATYLECDQLNSSGSLIPIESWKKIGVFNEDFFIDHVETDWCFRAKALGYVLFGALDSVFDHEIGDKNCEYWLFGSRSTPYRKPIRHYYIFRNSLYLQKQSYVPKRWKALNILKLAFTFIYFGFFLDDSKEQRKNILRGISDAVQHTQRSI